MLLQKLLPTAELHITDQHSLYTFCLFVLHIALPAHNVAGKAFPVWLSTALYPLTYGFLKATALRYMNRNYSAQMAVSVNNSEW